jgi:hypothetical protein
MEDTNTNTVTTRKCASAECSNEFSPARSDQRFCSDKCRSAHTRYLKKNGLNPEPRKAQSSPSSQQQFTPAPMVSAGIGKIDIPDNMPLQAQWVMKQQDREIDRLTGENQKLVSKCEQITTERDKLRDDIAELKTENKIRDIENAKPTGLNGLFPSGLEGFLNNPHIAPVVAALMGKILNVSSPPGVDAPTENDAVSALLNWINSQPEEVQQSFGELMSLIVPMEGDKVASILKQMINLVKNGSAMHQQSQGQTMNATQNYAYN